MVTTRYKVTDRSQDTGLACFTLSCTMGLAWMYNLPLNNKILENECFTMEDERDLLLYAGALQCPLLAGFCVLFNISWAEESTERDVALTTSIMQANLKTVAMGWTSSRHPFDAILARHLFSAVQQSLTIRVLYLHGDCPALIACPPNLRDLCLDKTSLNAEDIRMLSRHFAETSTLTTLQMVGVTLNTDDLKRLSKGLANNTSVTTLCLFQCQVDDDGVKAFLKYRNHNSIIGTLSFSHNRITSEGAMLLLQAASSLTAMESLNLGSNANIGYEGLSNIGLDLAQVDLKRLIVNSTVSNPSNMDACKLVADIMLQGMDANTSLLGLDFSKNGLEAVAPGLESSIQFFTLRNKYIPLMLLTCALAPTPVLEHSKLQPPTIWCHAFAKNINNPSFIFYFIKEQPSMWYQGVWETMEMLNPIESSNGMVV